MPSPSFAEAIAKALNIPLGPPPPSPTETAESEVLTREPQRPETVQTLADLYSSSFGSAVDGGAVAVVPVGPEQGGGGGLSLGAIAIVAALGFGGWWLYKKARAA